MASRATPMAGLDCGEASCGFADTAGIFEPCFPGQSSTQATRRNFLRSSSCVLSQGVPRESRLTPETVAVVALSLSYPKGDTDLPHSVLPSFEHTGSTVPQHLHPATPVGRTCALSTAWGLCLSRNVSGLQ